MPYDFGRKNDSHSTYFDVQLCLWAQLPTSHKRQWNSKREVNPAHVCTDPKLDTSLRLTKEAESPAHQWVEVTAVPGGHCLLWPVKLFGRVLDQKQHGLRYCNLLGITETHREEKNIQMSWGTVYLVGVTGSVTQPRASATDFSVGSICTDTGVGNTGTYGRGLTVLREKEK